MEMPSSIAYRCGNSNEYMSSARPFSPSPSVSLVLAVVHGKKKNRSKSNLVDTYNNCISFN